MKKINFTILTVAFLMLSLVNAQENIKKSIKCIQGKNLKHTDVKKIKKVNTSLDVERKDYVPHYNLNEKYIIKFEKDDNEIIRFLNQNGISYEFKEKEFIMDNSSLSLLKNIGVRYKIIGNELTYSNKNKEKPTSISNNVKDDYWNGSNTNDIDIPDNGYAYSVLHCDMYGTITNVKYDIRVYHEWVSDLEIRIYYYNEYVTEVVIWDNWGGEEDEGYDDDYWNDHDIEFDWRETSAFNGMEMQGNWYLDCYDQAAGDVGYIDWFKLKVYYCTVPNTPTGVTASDGTYCDEVHMDWNDVSGATYYKIYKGSSCGTYLGQVTGSACTITNASSSNTKYCVTACNDCGCSSASSNYGYAKTTPSTPTGVSASDGTYCDKVRITWNSVSGATSYDVYRSSTFLTNTSSTSCDDYGASTSSTTYKVYAKNSCGTSSSYGSDSGYKKDVPSTPTGVSATDGTYCDKVRITWNSVSGATKYIIKRDGSTLSNNCTSTSFDNNNPTPGQTYNYCVYAGNDCGWSGSACDNGYKKDVPSTPTGVTASNGTYCNKVQITWDNVSGATKYKITRDGTTLTESCTSTSYDDNDAIPGQTYNYCVYAGNDCGWSGSACDDGYKKDVPSTPTDVSASDDNSNKVTITWDNVSEATKYKITRDGTTLTESCTSTPYDDNDATSGQTYNYCVYAGNDCGWSGSACDDGIRPYITYTLSLTKDGNGDGQIKVNSSIHNLPYSETFDSGTSVSLEAVSSSGSSFTSWSNDLSGSTNPTSITMNSNKNVVVNFNSDPNTYTLSLTKGGDGDGQIKVNSSTHNLPYSETFDSGTSVSLEAVSSSGSSFTGWSGDLSGSTNPTSITMNEDKAIIVGLVTGIWSVDNEKFNIKIYPNPATNTINIVFEDKSYKDINVSLLNTQGQVVSVIEKDKLVSDNLQLDLSECSNGIYYLYIQTDKGAIIRKVSVMK